MRWAIGVFITGGAAFLSLSSACGSHPFTGDAGTDGSFGDSPTFGDTQSGDGNCQNSCSSDLHSVVDCQGNVISTCPPDQGCGANGTCVAPCDSANVNKSTFGCDYYVVDPDIITGLGGAGGSCFAAFVANTWGQAVTLAVDWGGQQLSMANAARLPTGNGQSLTYAQLSGANHDQLNAGEVAIVFLNRFGQNPSPFQITDCPAGITPGINTVDTAVHGTAIGKAFHLTSTAPVVAYDILPFGGGQSAATSATLLIPTSAWDTNYIAVNAFAKDQVVPQAQPFFEVTASQDNTTVTIAPTAAIVGGTGVAPVAANAVGTYVLNHGQYLQITQDAELTGTPIQSDKPVGVWGGATCLNIDVNDAACDSAHQQLFPVATLGHEYTAVRYRDRYGTTTTESEMVPWRIVGAVDGTQLTYEPSTPSGAPLVMNHKAVKTFWSATPFVVKSQDDKHPFYLAAHMTGADYAGSGGNEGRGDPEWVNVIPAAEWLASYVFFTDPTYPETDLVLTRAKGSNGFADVFLDCHGNSPIAGWKSLGASGEYQYARVDLVSGNFQKQAGCDNGRHEMHSTAPFGLTVWGWGSPVTAPFSSTYVSYAYPAGASVKPINLVVVPAQPN
jgi:hypothetical protein